MRKPLPARLLLVFALAVLALVGADTSQGFVRHTDDGCRTEIHCQACRTGLARIAVAGAIQLPPVLLVACPAEPISSESDLARPAIRLTLLRGPPSVA